MACNPPAGGNNSSTNPFVVGTDGPAAIATLGYTINHFSLLVSDFAETRRFYGDVLGMRVLFTNDFSPNYSIMYMGHSQGGKNGTGFMTGEELLREKDNLSGLIEFLTLKNSPRRKFDPVNDAHQTFSHIGLIVPDIQATQDWMKSNNVTIVKEIGAHTDLSSTIPAGFGMTSPEEIEADTPGVEALGFLGFLVIADPDGNLIEVQQQV